LDDAVLSSTGDGPVCEPATSGRRTSRPVCANRGSCCAVNEATATTNVSSRTHGKNRYRGLVSSAQRGRDLRRLWVAAGTTSRSIPPSRAEQRVEGARRGRERPRVCTSRARVETVVRDQYPESRRRQLQGPTGLLSTGARTHRTCRISVGALAAAGSQRAAAYVRRIARPWACAAGFAHHRTRTKRPALCTTIPSTTTHVCLGTERNRPGRSAFIPPVSSPHALRLACAHATDAPREPTTPIRCSNASR